MLKEFSQAYRRKLADMLRALADRIYPPEPPTEPAEPEPPKEPDNGPH